MKDPYVDKLGHHVEPKHVSIQVMAEMDQMSKTIKRQRDYIKKLEARIEELISSKGIKELEAVADAEAHAADFKAECDEKDKVIECITNVALQVIVKVREKEREAIAKMAESFSTVTLTGKAFAEVVRNRSNKDA